MSKHPKFKKLLFIGGPFHGNRIRVPVNSEKVVMLHYSNKKGVTYQRYTYKKLINAQGSQFLVALFDCELERTVFDRKTGKVMTYFDEIQEMEF